MTVDGLVELAATVNPGFFVIAAALFAAIAKGPLRPVALLGGPIVALVVLLYAPAAGVEVSRSEFLGFELALYRPDSLSLVFGLGFVVAALLGGIYSLHRQDRLQDAAGLVYAGSALGAVFAGDLVTLVIFWELSAVASAVLIFARRTYPAWRAGIRYLVIQSISGLLLIGGVTLYGVSHGGFLMSDLGGLADGVLLGLFDVSTPGGLMILVAVGIKAAFPLTHNWLTDAYPNTTETGAVVLSPYTTTLAVYVLARGFSGLDALVWIGAVMAIYPIFFAVLENDLRKVLAYSTNNQIGIMVCAIGIGTPLALNGAAALAFAHILFKGLLFMCMGAVWLRLGTTKATELGGLHRTMPYTTLFCLIGALSISALPFFSGFAAKSMIMTSAHAGQGLYAIWLILLFASAGVLEHAGIKIPYFAFFSHDSGKRPQEAPFPMLLAMGAAAGLSMAIGLYPAWFYQLMPFRDAALEYLAQDLFTARHMLEQFQLLAFALLAFLILKRARLYPAEQPGVIIDAEWLWRRGGPWLVHALRTPLQPGMFARMGGFFARHSSRAGAALFAPGGWSKARLPLSQTGVLALVMLAAVLALSLAVSRAG